MSTPTDQLSRAPDPSTPSSSPSSASSASPRVIRLHPSDDVVIALDQLVSGTLIAREGVTVSGLIPPGHKMATRDIALDYAYAQDAKPTHYATSSAHFDGIVRPDGKVATRNYIGVLTSVNCS